jgi:TolB-like protein
MKKRTSKLLLLPLVGLLISGCSTMSGMPLMDSSSQRYKVTQAEINAGRVNEYTQFLAEQIAINRDTYNVSNNPIAITSFVNLENYKHTNKLGELLADNMIHEMQIRGFKVTDFKSMPAIEIADMGDFIRSREAKELRSHHNINLVLSGTYTNHQGGVIVNARMVDIGNGMVVSTAQTNIPSTVASAIFGNYNPQEWALARQGVEPENQIRQAKRKKIVRRKKSNHICFENGGCIRGR